MSLHRTAWIASLLVAVAVGMAAYSMYDTNTVWMIGLQSVALPGMLSVILVRKIKTNPNSKKLLYLFLIFAATSFVAETYAFLDDTYWMTEQFPSIADIFWMIGYASLVGFCWKNVKHLQKLISKNIIALTFGIAITSLIPTIFIAQQQIAEEPLALVTTLSYPMLDTVIIMPLVLGSVVFIRIRNNSWIFLLMASSAFLIGDLAYPYLELSGTYMTGHPIDIAWIAGYLLFIAAAISFDERKINWITSIKENKNFIRFENVYRIIIPLMLSAILLVAVTTIYQMHVFGGGFSDNSLTIYWLIGIVVAFTGVILTINHNLTKIVKSRTEQLTKQTLNLESQIKEKNELIALQKQLEYEIEYQNKEITKKSLLLEEQNKKLLEIDKQKAEFASMVTHELKTPLTPILSWCDILLQHDSLGSINDEQKKAITKVRHNAKKLLKLISDILDAEKLGLNQMTFNYKNINMSEFLSELSETYAPILAEKKISYHVSCPKDLILHLDELRLSQVLKNFINNSIDFVPEQNGKIQLKIEEGPEFVTFSVIDNGIGISKEKQQNLFQKFYQVDTSSTRKHGGSGLGLSICKGIIESFGGDVGVQSESGVGSTFYFKIPKKSIPTLA